MKSNRFRFITLLGVIALAVASCSSSSDSTAETTTPSTAAQTTESSSTSSTSTTTTSTTVPAPTGPIELALSPVTVDNPDPKLTVVHLESILVEMIEGFLVVTFDQTLFGLNAGIVDRGDSRIDCWNPLDDSGTTTCSVFRADGSTAGEAYPLGDLVLTTEQIALPAVADATTGMIAIVVDGEVYESPKITFMDGPVMVQIDVNSGGFANEVTRVMGEATAEELAAALG